MKRGVQRMLAMIGAFIVGISCLAAPGGSAFAQGDRLPTTEEFNGMLDTCAAGHSIAVDSTLIGSISKLYSGDQTKGKLTFQSQADFLKSLPDGDRLKGYQLYTQCIDVILRGRLGAARTPAIAVQNVMAYANLDETSVGFVLTNPSGADEDVRGLKVGFYDAAGRALRITQAPDAADARITAAGSLSLNFTVVEPPRTIQICATVAGASANATVADARVFLVFHPYPGMAPPMGQFVEPAAAEAQRLGDKLICPTAMPSADAGCSRLLAAAGEGSDNVPNRIPALAEEALTIARARAPDSRLENIYVSDQAGRLSPTFMFQAARSGKNIGVSAFGCRLRASVSDFDGSGYPPFDGAFIDLPDAVEAARVKGFRGKLQNAQLKIEPAGARGMLVWELVGNFTADMGTFFFVAATPRPGGGSPAVWRCRVISMDGTQYKCAPA